MEKIVPPTLAVPLEPTVPTWVTVLGLLVPSNLIPVPAVKAHFSPQSLVSSSWDFQGIGYKVSSRIEGDDPGIVCNTITLDCVILHVLEYFVTWAVQL